MNTMKKQEKLKGTQNLIDNVPPINVINDLISETHGLLNKPINLGNSANSNSRAIYPNINPPNPSFTYTACCTLASGTVV